MQNTNRFARYSIVATAVLLVLALAFPETVLADYPKRKILCVRGSTDTMIDIVAENNRAHLLEKIAVKDLGPVSEVAFNRGARTAGIPASAPTRWVRVADVVLAPRSAGVTAAKKSGKAASGAQLGGAPTDPCAGNVN
tara:strand:- start:1949 stop:2362 length:414 start_codon:yes stop_codon:yes gene_type:complete